MSTKTTEVKVWGVNFQVDYYYDKGEPMVMYYPDGSGHPGSPPSVEIEGVFLEGNEQDLFECLAENLIIAIEEIILDSYE